MLLTISALLACKKDVPPPEVMAPPPPQATDAAPAQAPEHVTQMARNFERVYFEFDSDALSASSKEALAENVAIMNQHEDVKVEVQGHADERGTTDYNMALGQRRGNAVVAFMTSQGIASSRLRVVSYGEERPANTSSTQQAWSENRRAEFIITWKGDAPVEGTVTR